MKLLRSAVFGLALAAQCAAYASVITVEFDVTILSKSVQGYPDQPMLPMEHQYASLAFDNSLTSVRRTWRNPTEHYSGVRSAFGEGNNIKIVSPIEALTAKNPVTGTSAVESSNVISQLWYNRAPPSYSDVSFGHTISASSTTRVDTHTNGPYSYEGETWIRTVGIASPTEYVGPVDETGIAAFNFTSNDLMAYLEHMRANGTAFSFYDGFTHSIRPISEGGYSWSGTAVITKIIGMESVEIPEPGSLALFGLILAGLGFSRRRQA